MPIGRLGQPGDIGMACMYLGSDLGAYVSGQILAVDGGWSQAGCGDMSRFLGKLLRQMGG